MSEEQLTLTSRSKAQQQSLSKRIFVTALEQLTCGHLMLKEDGQLLASFGDVESSLVAEIDVIDQRFYRRALAGGTAVGEAFVDHYWITPDVTRVVQLFARNLHVLDAWEARLGFITLPLAKLGEFRRRNTIKTAKNNILSHYDLGNDLYEKFLDERMQYSSALFETENGNLNDSLEVAQENKLRRICEQLELSTDDHLLEIGSGWGGLAMFAAKEYGCRVTTTTISDAQFSYAQQRIEKNGLQDKITLLNQDYRALTGQYSKLVSVEMIEAVGQQYLPTFFNQIEERLAPGSKMLLQAITIADQRYKRYAGRTDFIRKHIFPGGFLPSLSLLSTQIAEHTSMVIRDVHDMGLDYAQTLSEWRQRLLTHRDVLRQTYDDRFFRLWLYYFGYCEAGFKERHISTVQILAEK